MHEGQRMYILCIITNDCKYFEFLPQKWQKLTKTSLCQPVFTMVNTGKNHQVAKTCQPWQQVCKLVKHDNKSFLPKCYLIIAARIHFD